MTTIEEIIRAVVREELAELRAELRALAAPRVEPVASPAQELPLTVEEVAKRAGGVRPETVRAWISDGKLPAGRAGHRWVVRRDDLERFLSSGSRDTIGHLQLVNERIRKARGT